jgi:hypothetical protein
MLLPKCEIPYMDIVDPNLSMFLRDKVLPILETSSSDSAEPK